MNIKGTINKFLCTTLGVELRKATRHSKLEGEPVAFERSRALKLLHFYELLRKIEHIEGDVVECGVGWGRSLFMLGVCDPIFNKERRYYGFDSFEGFPEPTPEDHLEDFPHIKQGYHRTQQDSVVKLLMNSGLNAEFVAQKVKLISGYFSESMHQYDGGDIALLHLDVDLYSSYKETLEFFYPKVVKGGVITFDEYQEASKYHQGAKKAIDEFFAERQEKIVRSHIIDRYYTIKE